jgi:FKBP-type peptidyl-prolyl cis-trans isomerase FklB
MKMSKMALFAGLAILLGQSACAQKGGKTKAGEMRTELDSLSYVLGSGLGQNIRQAELKGIVPELVLQGLLDGMQSDEAVKIDQMQGQLIIGNIMQKQRAEKAKASMEKANAYMDKVAKDATYKSTPSGVYYKVLTQGVGPRPAATDQVKVHYEGRLADGTVFDSSYERGMPAEFPLNRVIQGWTEMLQYMEVGTTVEATLPPVLAYGEQGSPPKIGPNEVLIFKIELIDITTPK